MTKALTKRRSSPPRRTTALTLRNASFRATAAQAGRAAATAGRAVARSARSVARRAGRRAVTVNETAPAWQETLALAGGAVGGALVSAVVRHKGWLEADTLAYGMTAGGLGGALLLPGMYRLAAGGMGAAGAAQIIYLEAQKLAGEKVRKELERLAKAQTSAIAQATGKPGERAQAALPQSYDRGLVFEQHLVDDAARLTDESMYAAPPSYAPAYAAAPM
jgi:hypothetical protein